MIQVALEAPLADWEKIAVLVTSFSYFHIEPSEGKALIEEAATLYDRTLRLIERVNNINREYKIKEKKESLLVFKEIEKEQVVLDGDIKHLLDCLEERIEVLEEIAKQYAKHRQTLEEILKKKEYKINVAEFIEQNREHLELLRQLRHLVAYVGVFNDESIEEFKQTCQYARIEFLEITLPQAYKAVIIVAPKKFEKKLEEKLDTLGFVPIDLILKVPISTRPVLEALNVLKTILSVAVHMQVEDSTLKLEGFIPHKRFKELKSKLEKNIPQAKIYPVEDTDVEIPTLLKGPFKDIMSMAGVPSHHEVDPTPIFNITFPLFFGLMFGDLGHGAVLALVGVLLRKFSPSASKRRWGNILFILGVYSMFFGLLAGEMFGTPLGYTPILTIFKDHHDIDAGKIMMLLGLCMLAGIIHISIGYIFKIINLLKEGEKGEAILFFIPLLIFYLCGVVLVGSTEYGGAVFSPEMGKIANNIIIACTLIMLFSRPKKLSHNLLEFFISVLELSANTVSYARLMILFMVHIFLMQTVNMAFSMGVLGIPIIILGNAGVIAMESIMAYIQSLRLHFYEFFTKFFEGKGKPFNPILVEVKNVVLRFNIDGFVATFPS